MIYLAAGNSEDALWSQLLVAVVLAAGWGVYSLFMRHKARHGSAGNTFGRLKDITAVAVREWLGLARHWLFDRAAQRTKISPEKSERFPASRNPKDSRPRYPGRVDFVFEISKRFLRGLSPGNFKGVSQGPETTEPVPLYRNIPAEQAIQSIPKKRDLTGGMELLAIEFLVMVVDGVVQQSPLQVDEVDQRDITKRRLCFDELVRRGRLWAAASSALKVYTVDEQGFYGKSIRCEAMKELATRTGVVPERGPSGISENPVEPHQPSEKAMESRLAGI